MIYRETKNVITRYQTARECFSIAIHNEFEMDTISVQLNIICLFLRIKTRVSCTRLYIL